MEDVPAYLSLTGCAALLGVGKRHLSRLARCGGFVPPIGYDVGDPYWAETDVLTWWAGGGPGQAAEVRLDLWPVPAGPAEFLGAERRPYGSGPDDVLQYWRIGLGDIAVLWRCDPSADNRTVAPVSDRDCSATVVVAIGREFGPTGPSLTAHQPGLGRYYRLDWSELARVLGCAMPYWAHALRYPDLIAAWRPGTPAVTAPARPDIDLAVLLRMAGLFRPSHAAHRTLLHLARAAQERATRGAIEDLARVANRIAVTAERTEIWPRDGAAIEVAATPLVVPGVDPALDEVDATTRRIGWMDLLGRPDTLSWACVRQAVAWDGGRDLPFGNPRRIDPTSACAAEWKSRLVPATRRRALFALLDGDLDRLASDLDRPAFVDPATDAPVVLDEDAQLITVMPERLPAQSPLSEVILDEELVWVRTADHTLYPAPRSHHRPSRGREPDADLAGLIHQLLHDINAATADDALSAPPGLVALTGLSWPIGAVVTRDVLEAARDGLPYSQP